MAHVIIDDPSRMNLLGLFLAHIISRNLEEPAQLKRFSKVKGNIVVHASAMIVSLCFAEGKLVISRGPKEPAHARVRGTMDSLMGMALGRGMIGLVLTGRIQIKGNPFLLLKIKPLLTVPEAT